MRSTIWLYFLILHGTTSLDSLYGVFTTEHDNHETDKHTSTGYLQKRSPRRNVELVVKLGFEALEKLLRRTRLLYTNGFDKILVKGGGYKQALSDLKSIDPDWIKENTEHGEILGSKGSLVLKLSQDGEFPKMSLEMKDMYHQHFKHKIPQYTIFYKRTLTPYVDKGPP